MAVQAVNLYLLAMIDLIKRHPLLENLPEQQAKIIHIRGARDMAKRGGIIIYVYIALLLCFFSVSTEVRSNISISGPLAFLVLLACYLRHRKVIQLAVVEDYLIEGCLKQYVLRSLMCVFSLGLFVIFVVTQSGFSTSGIFVIIGVCAMASGAIGTFNLFFKAWVSFIVILCGSIAIASLIIGIEGQTIGYSFAIGCIIYAAGITVIGKRVADEYWRAQVSVIALACKMEELEQALKLVEEQEVELRLHRDNLQKMVDEQTADLREAKETAESAIKLKDEFLANITHELRTPLHAIQSFSKLGIGRLDRLSKEKLEKYFSQINTNGKRMISLVDDLLDLSKLNSMKMSFSFEQTDLAELLESSIHELEALLVEKKHRIDIAQTNCGTTVVLDRFRIRQVIVNLISNAIKFSHEGSLIKVSISADDIEQGHRDTDQSSVPALRVCVTDQGVGVPEDELGSVFEKFTQSRLTKSGAGGTGLGLAICREIILKHDGYIQAENMPQGGASFYFIIPQAGPLRYQKKQRASFQYQNQAEEAEAEH